MSEQTDNAIFTREVQRKVDGLIHWIVESAPTKTHRLSASDFSEARQSIYRILTGDTNLQHIEPEPAEGGAQYINDNPAPWP